MVNADDLLVDRRPYKTTDRVNLLAGAVPPGCMHVAVDRADFEKRVLTSGFGLGYQESPCSTVPVFTWTMQTWVCLIPMVAPHRKCM
jgi:hypothetical protein